MAASLTLSAVAVAADGKTITATISGGTGAGYAIASTVGLQPHLAIGKVFSVATAAVAGTTLTVTLYSPIGTGESVQFTITTGATLTDGGGNTPTGQNNLAMTNNSAVAVTILDALTAGLELAALFTGGSFQRSSAAVGNGIDVYSVEFVANATDIAIMCLGSGTTTAVLDGAAPSNIPTTDSGGHDIRPITLASLAAGNHLVLVNFSDYFGGVRLAGGTSSIVSVATTKALLITGSENLTGIPNATPVQLWGSWQDRAGHGGNVGEGSINANYIGLVIDFLINGTGAEMFGITFNGAGWACSVDGAGEGALLLSGDSAMNNNFGYCPVAWGNAPGQHTMHVTSLGAQFAEPLRWIRVINGTKTTASSAINATTLTVADVSNLAVNHWVRIDAYGAREWRKITGIAGSVITVAALSKAHAAGVQVTSYQAAAGTIGAWTKKDLSARRIVGMGDSTTAAANDYGSAGTPDANGTYYNLYDPRWSPMWLGGNAIGWEFCNLGIQGETSAQMAARASDIAAYGRSSFDVLTIWAGTNDINSSSITPAQWKANIITIINAATPYLRAGGKIIVMPTPTPNGITNAGGLNFAQEQAKITELVAAYPGVVIDGSPAVARIVLADESGVHYHISGQQKIAQDLIPLAAATELFVNVPGPYAFPVAAMTKI